jgi:hypothetical protein
MTEGIFQSAHTVCPRSRFTEFTLTLHTNTTFFLQQSPAKSDSQEPQKLSRCCAPCWMHISHPPIYKQTSVLLQHERILSKAKYFRDEVVTVHKASRMWHCNIGWLLDDVLRIVLPSSARVKQCNMDSLPMRTEAPRILEMSRTTHPTQHHISEDLNPHPFLCDNLKCCIKKHLLIQYAGTKKNYKPLPTERYAWH